jgi:REP element-mobilizing transposase RayT
MDVFIRNEYKDILLDSWRYCILKKSMELYAWCIMTSHVHMIIGSHGNDMETIMRDMKRHTSMKIKAAIKSHPHESRKEWLLWMMKNAGNRNSNNKDFQFWQQDNHPIELNDPRRLHQKLEYIHNNPVVSGFVDKAEEYLYSSARDYYGGKGLIDITLLDPIIYGS